MKGIVKRIIDPLPKKKMIFAISILFIATLFSCANSGNTVDMIDKTTKIESVKSFGNQVAQKRSVRNSIKEGDWIYAIRNLSNEKEGIVRIQIDNSEKQELIYQYTKDHIQQLSVLDDWVYFLIGTGDHGNEKMELRKIKTDGSEETALAQKVSYYVLTNKEIYLDSYMFEFNSNLASRIYAIDLFGGNKRKLGGKNLLGVDNGWVYYSKRANELHDSFYLYRMKPDGTYKEKLHDEAIVECIVDFDNVFFTKFDEGDKETITLFQKTIYGKKTTITTSESIELLNKDNEEMLYFDVNNGNVNKVNVINPEEKEVVYGVDTSVNSILLYDGEAIITTYHRTLYIKQNGTIIELKA